MFDKKLLGRMAAAVGSVALMGFFATPAQAEVFNVQIRGTVDYNIIQGGLAEIGTGAPVLLSFNVDSDSYVNSGDWPTRGDRVDLSSFSLDIGGVKIAAQNPQPEGADMLFVLRNDDPLVDGFFLSPGPDYRFPVAVRVPGLNQLNTQHDLEFGRTFDTTTTLTSLDIRDAVGHYEWEYMSSYMFTLGRYGGTGLEAMYESITISAVPEPASVLSMGAGLMLLAAARRRRAAAAA